MDRARAQRLVVARRVGRRVGERAGQRERGRHVARERAGQRRAVGRVRVVGARARADEHRARRAAQRRAARGDQPAGVGLPRQIGVEHDRAAAARGDFGDQRVGCRTRRAGAALRELRRERTAERGGVGRAAERAGDERDARGRRIG